MLIQYSFYFVVFATLCIVLYVKMMTMLATLNEWLCLFVLSDSLCSLLWNLYKYYTQFSESIQTKITQLRTPIEKELKVGETKAYKIDVEYTLGVFLLSLIDLM